MKCLLVETIAGVMYSTSVIRFDSVLVGIVQSCFFCLVCIGLVMCVLVYVTLGGGGSWAQLGTLEASDCRSNIADVSRPFVNVFPELCQGPGILILANKRGFLIIFPVTLSLHSTLLNFIFKLLFSVSVSRGRGRSSYHHGSWIMMRDGRPCGTGTETSLSFG